MSTSQSTAAQIASARPPAQSGKNALDLCRHFGILQATIYTQKKDTEIGVSVQRKLRKCDNANAHRKHTVADLTLDKQVLDDGARAMALKAVERRGPASGCMTLDPAVDRSHPNASAWSWEESYPGWFSPIR